MLARRPPTSVAVRASVDPAAQCAATRVKLGLYLLLTVIIIDAIGAQLLRH
jgi:hypothetical protein